MYKEFDFDNASIRYSVSGVGRPVILVHGFGETGLTWNLQLASLEKNYQVIIPDLPGSGGSGLTDDMSLEVFADMLAAMLDNEQVTAEQRPVMFGHSMGGYVMLAFVERHPGILSAFGLIHSSAFADSAEKKDTRRKGIGFIREHGATAFLKNTSINLFSPETKTRNPELVSGFIDGLTNFSGESLVRYYQAMIARPDRTEVLKNTMLPVLFILGKHDTAVPPEDVLKQTAFPEKSYIHMLPHSGHLGMIEEPVETNLFLEQFISEN